MDHLIAQIVIPLLHPLDLVAFSSIDTCTRTYVIQFIQSMHVSNTYITETKQTKQILKRLCVELNICNASKKRLKRNFVKNEKRVALCQKCQRLLIIHRQTATDIMQQAPDGFRTKRVVVKRLLSTLPWATNPYVCLLGNQVQEKSYWLSDLIQLAHTHNHLHVRTVLENYTSSILAS